MSQQTQQPPPAEGVWNSTVNPVAPGDTSKEAFCQEMTRLFPAVPDLGKRIKEGVLDPHGADVIRVMHGAKLKDVTDGVKVVGLLSVWVTNLARYILGPDKMFSLGDEDALPGSTSSEAPREDMKGGWKQLAFPRDAAPLAVQLGGFHLIKKLRLPHAAMKQLRTTLCVSKPDVTSAYNILFMFSIMALRSGYIEGALKTRFATILHMLNPAISIEAHMSSLSIGFSNRRQGRYLAAFEVNTKDQVRHNDNLQAHMTSDLKNPLRIRVLDDAASLFHLPKDEYLETWGPKELLNIPEHYEEEKRGKTAIKREFEDKENASSVKKETSVKKQVHDMNTVTTESDNTGVTNSGRHGVKDSIGLRGMSTSMEGSLPSAPQISLPQVSTPEHTCTHLTNTPTCHTA